MSIQTPEKGRAEWSAQGITDTPTTRTSEPAQLAARLAKLEAVIYGKDECEQLDASPVPVDTSVTDASLEDRLAQLERLVAARHTLPRGRGKRHSSQLGDYLNNDRRRALTRHREKKSQKPEWAHSAVDRLAVQARSKADRKQAEEEARKKQEESSASPNPTVVDVTRLAMPGLPRGPGLPLPAQLAGRPETASYRSTSPYPQCTSPYPRSGKSPTPRQEVELRKMGYHQCRPDMRSAPARKRCYSPGHSSRNTSLAHGQGWGRPVPATGMSCNDLRDRKRRHDFLSPHREQVDGAVPRPSLMLRTYEARVAEPVPAPARRSRSCPAWTADLHSHVKTVPGLAESGEHCSSQRALREMTKRHRVSRDIML